jgi:RNA polymerase sigma factor (sigma-70 family)
MTDAQLLRHYAATRDEQAFAQLVGRYADLVYSAALRQVAGDEHRAREIMQTVFLTLARRAAQLVEHPVLAAWLLRCTGLVAKRLRREESRRRKREEAAARFDAIAEEAADPEVDWTMVAPYLDAALQELGERDREAVVLRYFLGLPYRELGQRLRLGGNAARMRTDRALEKLRRGLARRGITSRVSVLGAMLGAHAVSAAPASAVHAALAAAGTASANGAGAGVGLALWNGFILMKTTSKVLLALAGGLLIGTGLGWSLRREPEVTPALSGSVARPVPAQESARPVARDVSASVAAPAEEERRLLARLQEREAELAEARLRLGFLDAMLEEVSARGGVKEGESIFSSLREAGLFAANVAHLASRILREFPDGAPAEGEGKTRYDTLVGQMQRDAAILAQDPLLLGEMLSDEADRVAEAQAAYVGPGVGLDAVQQARLTELLKEAYAEAHAQGLNKRAKPTEEAKIRAWDEAREQLNKRTVDKIKAGLSPEQRQLFEQLGHDYLLFLFRIGA